MQLHQIIGLALSQDLLLETVKTSNANYDLNNYFYSSAIMGRGLTPNPEFSNNVPNGQKIDLNSMTKMYKTAFKSSNMNNSVLAGATFTPLPDATGRTNTALGYK